MAGINELDMLVEQKSLVAQQEEQRKLAKLELQKQVDTVQNATAGQVASLNDLSAFSQTVTTESEALKAKVDYNNAQAKVINGTDLSAAGNALATLSAQKVDTYNKAVAAKDNLAAQKAAATDLSNPFGAIMASIGLKSAQVEYNNLASKYNMIESRTKDMVADTTAIGQMNNVTAQTTSAAKVLALNQQTAAETAFKIGQLTKENAKSNMDAISALQTMDAQGFQAATQLNLMKGTVIGIQLQRQHMAITEENAKLARAAAADRLEEKQTTREMAELDLHYYNLGAERMGVAQLANYNQLRSLNKNVSAMNILQIGQQMALKGGNSSGVPVAQTAADAGAFMISIRSQLPVSTDSPERIITTLVAKAAADPAAGKDPAKIKQIANITIEDQQKQMAQSIPTDGSVNMYRAPSLKAVYDSSELVRNNSFVTSIIKPQIDANPTVPVNPDMLLQTAAALVKANPQQLNEATNGIVTFFQGAMLTNNAQRNFESYGLLPQKTYNAAIKTGSMWNTNTVNLADPLEVKRILMRQSGSVYINPNNRGRSLGTGYQ